jgi:hypothetical protein
LAALAGAGFAAGLAAFAGAFAAAFAVFTGAAFRATGAGAVLGFPGAGVLAGALAGADAVAFAVPEGAGGAVGAGAAGAGAAAAALPLRENKRPMRPSPAMAAPRVIVTACARTGREPTCRADPSQSTTPRDQPGSGPGCSPDTLGPTSR